MKRMLATAVCGLVLTAYAADELDVTTGWTYDMNGRKRVLSPTLVSFPISGAGVIENVQAVVTNAAGSALVLGDVTNPGFAWFKNSSTNHIEIGCYDSQTNFVPFLKLYPTNAMPCWLGTTAPRARASNVSSRLDYMISDR